MKEVRIIWEGDNKPWVDVTNIDYLDERELRHLTQRLVDEREKKNRVVRRTVSGKAMPDHWPRGRRPGHGGPD